MGSNEGNDETVGEEVGRKVVGALVVGTFTGLAVGPLVGLFVGFVVGLDVGFFVGCPVGIAEEGAGVVIAVGLPVGELVVQLFNLGSWLFSQADSPLQLQSPMGARLYVHE